jgi:hypothetical protein
MLSLEVREMALVETHNGDIKSDPIGSPDYVWLRCSRYDLPDNTTGAIGYYVAYRPLASDWLDKGLPVTAEMRAHVREHLAIIATQQDEARAARESRRAAAIPAEYARETRARANGLCPRCHTYCYGDCRR